MSNESIANLESLKTNLDTLWAQFTENHAIFADKGNKAAAARARKAINELKKHITAYKKASVETTKAVK